MKECLIFETTTRASSRWSNNIPTVEQFESRDRVVASQPKKKIYAFQKVLISLFKAKKKKVEQEVSCLCGTTTIYNHSKGKHLLWRDWTWCVHVVDKIRSLWRELRVQDLRMRVVGGDLWMSSANHGCLWREQSIQRNQESFKDNQKEELPYPARQENPSSRVFLAWRMLGPKTYLLARRVTQSFGEDWIKFQTSFLRRQILASLALLRSAPP